MDLPMCFFPPVVNQPLGIGMDDSISLHSVRSISSNHREGSPQVFVCFAIVFFNKILYFDFYFLVPREYELG